MVHVVLLSPLTNKKTLYFNFPVAMFTKLEIDMAYEKIVT